MQLNCEAVGPLARCNSRGFWTTEADNHPGRLLAWIHATRIFYYESHNAGWLSVISALLKVHDEPPHGVNSP